MIIRSAAAFGVKEIIIVGNPKYNAFGAQGTDKHMSFRTVKDMAAARDFLKSKNCTIYGVEITTSSQSVVSHPFHGNAAFMMGNEVLLLSCNICRLQVHCKM